MFRVRNPGGTFTLHRVRREKENTSSSALKSGATARPEILVILGHEATARQETSPSCSDSAIGFLDPDLAAPKMHCRPL